MDIGRLRNIFIQIINNVKESDEKNIELLVQFIHDNDVEPINILNEEDFDVLIFALESRASEKVIEYVLRYIDYGTYNYTFFITDNYRNYDPKFHQYYNVDYLVPLFSAIRNEYFEIADILIKQLEADINYLAGEYEDGNDDNIVIYLFSYFDEMKLSSLNYILKHEFYRRGFPIDLINYMLLNKSNYPLLESIFKHYIYDNSFILKLLSIYQYRTSLSSAQFTQLFQEEKAKIKINDISYANAIKNENFKGLGMLLKYDSYDSDPDDVFF